jgi:SAM-dependent methyltransferase
MSTTQERDDWDAHWSEFADAAADNPAQAYRRRLVLDLLSPDVSPARVLDIGSGTGELIEEILRRWPDASALGLELSESGVAVSRRRTPSARFRVCDLLTEAVPPAEEAAWATHAVCSEVLEHVDDPVELLRKARAWMAPGCRLIVTVPGGPMSAFDRHIGHRRHFSPIDIGDVIREAGLTPVQGNAAGFPFHNLYRMMVIARGERLVGDARPQSEHDGRTSPLVRAGLATFGPLFRLNRPRSRFGWQTVAVAVEPS